MFHLARSPRAVLMECPLTDPSQFDILSTRIPFASSGSDAFQSMEARQVRFRTRVSQHHAASNWAGNSERQNSHVGIKLILHASHKMM